MLYPPKGKGHSSSRGRGREHSKLGVRRNHLLHQLPPVLLGVVLVQVLAVQLLLVLPKPQPYLPLHLVQVPKPYHHPLPVLLLMLLALVLLPVLVLLLPWQEPAYHRVQATAYYPALCLAG